MKSRLIAGVAAVVLALVGAVLVYGYAQNADARASAELEPVDVLVVADAVPAGTDTAVLAESLTLESLPGSAVADTALKDLKSAAGKVTAVDLVPGEQLVAERLVAPGEAQGAATVEVPEGLQEVSFQLEPQRVVGGQIRPGDHIGIFISFDGGALEESPEQATTQFSMHKVLVTNVQGAAEPAGDNPEEEAAELPEGSLMLTVAVDAPAATKIVFAAEFSRIWLSKEPLDATEGDGDVMIKPEVYE